MIDTHAHLNFKRLSKDVDVLIKNAQAEGVTNCVVPSADERSSEKAVELAKKYFPLVFAAVGIHPHHAYESGENSDDYPQKLLNFIENIVEQNKKYIVAIGEIGLDRHIYEDSKYGHYSVDNNFLERQKKLLKGQLQVALTHNLAVILHNRESTDELLAILTELWDEYFRGRMVFHCCEPRDTLLQFAIKHGIFIGVDGDVTYDTPEAEKKRAFVKRIPDELLVLETDAPFLLPEPLRAKKKYPNVPAYLKITAECVARIRGVSFEEIDSVTTENARRLFTINIW